MANVWIPPAWLDGGEGRGEHKIPLVPQPYDEQLDRAGWKARCVAWAASGRQDARLLDPYQDLADPTEKKFIVLWRDQPGYGWPEDTVSLAMMKDGYTCWTGVQFFTRHGKPTTAPLQKRVTTQALTLLQQSGHRLPRDYYRRLTARETMRNPDLVCYHPTRKQWRFIEDKHTDRIDQRKLNSLAFLHAITGATVEVRQLVAGGRSLSKSVAGVGQYRLLE